MKQHNTGREPDQACQDPAVGAAAPIILEHPIRHRVLQRQPCWRTAAGSAKLPCPEIMARDHRIEHLPRPHNQLQYMQSSPCCFSWNQKQQLPKGRTFVLAVLLLCRNEKKL